MGTELVKEFFFPAANTSLTAINYKGRDVMLAGELERVLEYTEGSLGRLIRKDKRRAKEKDAPRQFRKGIDYDVIEGADLDHLREAFSQFAAEPGSAAIDSMTRSVVALYRPGIDLVCIRTDKVRLPDRGAWASRPLRLKGPRTTT